MNSSSISPKPTSPHDSAGNPSTPRIVQIAGDLFPQTSQRKVIAEGIESELISVPLTNFMDHYLPWQPTEANIQEGLSKITAFITDGKLSLGEGNERTRFWRLSEIAELLGGVSVNGRASDTAYIHCPDNSLFAEKPGT